MNKKILFFSVLTVFLFLSLTFASAIQTEKSKEEKKISPLFKIRTNMLINKENKLNILIDNFKNRLNNRVFFIPLIFTFKKTDNSDATFDTVICRICRMSQKMDGCCATQRHF